MKMVNYPTGKVARKVMKMAKQKTQFEGPKVPIKMTEDHCRFLYKDKESMNTCIDILNSFNKISNLGELTIVGKPDKFEFKIHTHQKDIPTRTYDYTIPFKPSLLVRFHDNICPQLTITPGQNMDEMQKGLMQLAPGCKIPLKELGVIANALNYNIQIKERKSLDPDYEIESKKEGMLLLTEKNLPFMKKLKMFQEQLQGELK
jgi:hypothetical protein